MNNIRWTIVTATVLAAIVAAFWILNKPAVAGYSTITGGELQVRIDAGEKLVIIDLREPELFRVGHIPGSKNVPFDQFSNRVSELRPQDAIVLVCHMGQMGESSGSLLALKGYAKVWNLKGGMTGWAGKLEK